MDHNAYIGHGISERFFSGAVGQMKQLNMNDLLDLAPIADAEARLEKVFDWHFERHKVVVEAVLVSFGAVLAGLLVAYLSADVGLTQFVFALIAVVAGFGAIGTLAYLELRAQKEDFLTALQILKANQEYVRLSG
jgi:hypothetical protein